MRVVQITHKNKQSTYNFWNSIVLRNSLWPTGSDRCGGVPLLRFRITLCIPIFSVSRCYSSIHALCPGFNKAMETKEVKVRLWGSGVGVGTSRYSTAVVPVSFMTAREYHPTSIKAKNTASAPSLKKRKHHHVDQQQLDNNNIDLPVDAAIECESDTLPEMIEFDSETGIGIRPEFSMLRLRSQTIHPEVVHSSTDWAEPEDGDPAHPAMDTGEAHEAATIVNHYPTTENALTNFWKSIEDSNYFHPFSKKSHRLEEVHIRGADYGKSTDRFTQPTSTSTRHSHC